jgi:hypothetical protein
MRHGKSCGLPVADTLFVSGCGLHDLRKLSPGGVVLVLFRHIQNPGRRERRERIEKAVQRAVLPLRCSRRSEVGKDGRQEVREVRARLDATRIDVRSSSSLVGHGIMLHHLAGNTIMGRSLASRHDQIPRPHAHYRT